MVNNNSGHQPNNGYQSNTQDDEILQSLLASLEGTLDTGHQNEALIGNPLLSSSSNMHPRNLPPTYRQSQLQINQHLQQNNFAQNQQLGSHVGFVNYNINNHMSNSYVPTVPSVSPISNDGVHINLYADSDFADGQIKEETVASKVRIPHEEENEEEKSSIAAGLNWHFQRGTQISVLCANPSVDPWPGQYRFKAKISEATQAERNKCVYSEKLNKLFVTPKIAIPVKLQMSRIVGSYVVVCPVYQYINNRNHPVNRCYNCMEADRNDDLKEHIVRAEGGSYFQHNERSMVSIPISTPPPGEQMLTIFLRVMCRTSCVGGPNRRPFCLVIMLVGANGAELGRDVINIKSCQSPGRDIKSEEKSADNRLNLAIQNRHAFNGMQSSLIDNSTADQIRSISRNLSMATTKPTKKKIKIDVKTSSDVTQITIPKRFEKKVKKLVNSLYCKEQAVKNGEGLLFSESDSD